MSSKSKPKSQAGLEATVEDFDSLLRTILLTSVQTGHAGKKLELSDDWKWDLWRICRRIAGQKENRLAKLLASPALAIVPIVADMLAKAEVALRSKSLGEEQTKQVEVLADQLDFSLALIYRELGCARLLELQGAGAESHSQTEGRKKPGNIQIAVNRGTGSHAQGYGATRLRVAQKPTCVAASCKSRKQQRRSCAPVG